MRFSFETGSSSSTSATALATAPIQVQAPARPKARVLSDSRVVPRIRARYDAAQTTPDNARH